MKENIIKLNYLKYKGSIIRLIDKHVKDYVLCIKLDDYSKFYKIEILFKDINTILNISIENKDSLSQAYCTSQVKVMQQEPIPDPIFIFSSILILNGNKNEIDKSTSDLINSLNEFLEIILSDYDKFSGEIRVRLYDGISDEKISFVKYEYKENQILSEDIDNAIDKLNELLINSPAERRFKIETIFNIADHTTVAKTLLVYKIVLMNGEQAFQASFITKVNDDVETSDIMLIDIDSILDYIYDFLYFLDRVYIKGTDDCKLNMYAQV